MVLTAHITYQNRDIYTEIHTQVTNQKIFWDAVVMFFLRWKLSSIRKDFLKSQFNLNSQRARI